jgi:hypothetical protein
MPRQSIHRDGLAAIMWGASRRYAPTAAPAHPPRPAWESGISALVHSKAEDQGRGLSMTVNGSLLFLQTVLTTIHTVARMAGNHTTT